MHQKQGGDPTSNRPQTQNSRRKKNQTYENNTPNVDLTISPQNPKQKVVFQGNRKYMCGQCSCILFSNFEIVDSHISNANNSTSNLRQSVTKCPNLFVK